jgi:hypothetical protein
MANLWEGVKKLEPWSLDWWESLGKAETWEDFLEWMGKNLIYFAEVMGAGEIYETFADFIKFATRPLNNREINIAKSVFGNSINYDLVRVDSKALLGPSWTDRAYVSFNTINSWGSLEDDILVHELTHVWQYQEDGAIYMPEALHAQMGEGYDYGGPNGLWQAWQANKPFNEFNREQQGQIVQDYYRIRESRKPGRSGILPPTLESANLDAYVYYVQAVSTLTFDQLRNVTPTTPVTPTPPTTPVNRIPVAVGDRLSTYQNRSASINVLENDRDPDGDTFTIQSTTNGSFGQVSYLDGRVTYTPNSPQFTGIDSFTYTIADSKGATSEGTVEVWIEPTSELTIADTEFFLQSWVAKPLYTTNGAQTNTRFAFWPNQGNVRGMQHLMPAAQTQDTYAFIFHEFQGGAYDPTVGEILSIDYAEEHLQFNPPFKGAEVFWAPAIKQNGVVYLGPTNRFTHSTSTFDTDFTPFKAVQLPDLESDDFVAFQSSNANGGKTQMRHPDFSEAGSEITFGYARSSSYTGREGVEWRDHAIDNWKFVLTVA